ncbi:MAG: hypothetical protein KGS10_05590 [Chloroflexi bacterium]|nr:hypothetical protein [Chloroflexota bacterium]
MSGGAYQYAYRTLETLAGDIEAATRQNVALAAEMPRRFYDARLGEYCSASESAPVFERIDAARLWLAECLRLAAQAARAVEWVDSCDCEPGYELDAIERLQAWAARDDG